LQNNQRNRPSSPPALDQTTNDLNTVSDNNDNTNETIATTTTTTTVTPTVCSVEQTPSTDKETSTHKTRNEPAPAENSNKANNDISSSSSSSSSPSSQQKSHKQTTNECSDIPDHTVSETATTTTTVPSNSEQIKQPFQAEANDDDSDSDDGADDVGGEAVDDELKKKKKQGKPRGIKPPEKREDQMACFVAHNLYNRRIIYMGVEAPFLLPKEKSGDDVEPIEWVPFKFVGDSFAYNQIRKMLGYVLHVAHGHAPVSSIPVALDSPFKINVPMTPGECLYLLGGTYLDRSHFTIDLFQFLPQSESAKYDQKTTKALPWHQLLENSSTSTAPGAPVLQRMKAFRDDVLHPHILSLFLQHNSYQEFIDGLSHERFILDPLDLERMQKMVVEWKKGMEEKKEKRRVRRREQEEHFEQVKKARQELKEEKEREKREKYKADKKNKGDEASV